jgi:hypothetical protein
MAKLIEQHHAPLAISHTGTAKTFDILSLGYFRVNIRDDVARFIRNCHTRSCTKASHQKPLGLLHPLKVPSNTWEEVSTNFVAGLPKTQSGHDTVLVIVNRLTKIRHFAPCSSKN